ncbi:MAG: hypothetical protein ACO25K_05210 [Candidatus Fonsibacter ubiquis]
MPIAKVQLQDGRIARFEVPDGTTPDEVMQFANNQFGEQQQVQPRTPTQPNQFLEKNTQPQPISQGEALLTTATNIPFAPRIKAGTAAASAKLIADTGISKIVKGLTNYNPEFVKDRSYADLYDEALSNELTKLRQAREQYPKQSFASQFASDIATGGTALKGLGLAGNTAKQALAGGSILGGTTALGETKDISNLPQSLTDLGAGALVGGIGGVAGQQAGKALGKASQALPQVIQRFKPNTPEKVLSKVITPEEAGTQARKLATKIEQGRITALPEQGDENILGLTRLLGKTQGSNKVIADYINTKSATSTKRVADLLNNNLSAESYFNKLDDTIARRKELSSPLYEQARIEGEQNLQKFLKTEKVKVSQPILNNKGEQLRDPATGTSLTKIVEVDAPAKKLYDNPNITKYVNAAKNEPLFVDPRLSNNSFEVLVGAKKMIDRDISAAKNIKDKESVSALIGIKRQVLDILEKASPTYKQANKLFAGESALLNAQEEGLNIGKLRNGEEVKRYLKTLTDGEKETYKIGVKDYLMDKAMKTGDANSSARKIFSQPLEREKIKAVFNNPKEFSDFARRMDDEIRVFDTKQRIVGGSRTDFNIQEGAELLDKVAKGAVNVKTFGISNIILASADAIKKRYYGLNEQTAKELAKIIVNPTKSVEVLNKIYTKAQTKQEQNLIQKFVKDLNNKNFTAPISTGLGRTQTTEQLNEENNNGI